MAIATQRSLSRTLILAGIISLAACGGGGGGGSKKTPDTTPAPFNFTASTNAALGTAVTSPAIAISGINTSTTVSITGGEYSINGGAFTSAPGVINPGQTVAVKVLSSAANSSATEATLTIGGVSATYRVSTLADAIPNAFTFTPAVNVALGSVNTSDTVTIAGIEVAVPISITGGEYSINGGAFTAAAGSVTNGQTITLKAIASSKTETIQNAVVTIGGVSGTYAVTTLADTSAPIAEFKFPTPYTMSEAMSVKVRGTATDDHAITNVKIIVNGTTEVQATPKAPGDYSSWTADAPLTALSENEIKVVATDDRNNEIEIVDANKVVIRQADVDSAFPNEDNQFYYFRDSIVLDIQSERNRLLLSGVNHDEKDEIHAIDLLTSKRTVAIPIEQDNCDSAEGMVIDPGTQHLFMLCKNGPSILFEYNLADGQFVASYDINEPNFRDAYGMTLDRNNGRNQLVLLATLSESDAEFSDYPTLIKFDLETKAFSVLAKAGQQPFISGARHIIVDGDRYLLTSGSIIEEASLHSIITVDANTGNANILSSNQVGTGELFSGELPNGYLAVLSGLAKDNSNKQLLVSELATSKLFSVDPATGNRSIFKNLSYVQPNKQSVTSIADIVIDESKNIAIIEEGQRTGVLLLDLSTREKVILTKSKND